MDKKDINIADMYKKYYEKYKKESICLNKNNWNIYNRFNFLFRGSYLAQFISSISCKELDFNTYKKTNDCKIIIDSIHTFIRFKLLIKKLELGINAWEYGSNFNCRWSRSIDGIKEKAIIDLLKKEIYFMKNRLKFEKLWFARLSRY